MSERYRHPYTIGLHDTDAFGIIYSANIIRICMIANEAMLKHLGYGLDLLFQRREFGMPVVHIEADFIKPLTVGMDVDVDCRVEKFGNASYRVAYQVLAKSGELYATGATVQVCVDAKTRVTMDLPVEFRKALETYGG
jgi:YbgC/YbaW family acyl-CoA thioester hydrolase